jgi:hypothetical protein
MTGGPRQVETLPWPVDVVGMCIKRQAKASKCCCGGTSTGGGIPAKPRYLLASGGASACLRTLYLVALRGCVRACGRRRGGRRTAGRFAQTLDRSLGGTVFLAHGLQ